jgi:hypothetical protein
MAVIKVVNESITEHEISEYREVGYGREKHREKQYSKTYLFPADPEIVVEIDKVDFDKMVNDDFMLTKIYTKDQWQKHVELVEKQTELDALYRSLEDSPAEQEAVRKKMALSDTERYLMYNVLPHVI